MKINLFLNRLTILIKRRKNEKIILTVLIFSVFIFNGNLLMHFRKFFMRKYFLLGIFSLISISLFAQQTERITYQELRANGTYRDITVNAIFMGWAHREFSLDGNFLVTYQCDRLTNEDKWSDWRLVERQPSPYSTLRGYYDFLIRSYFQYPRLGIKSYYNEYEILAMPSIPNGRSSPIWWREDGRAIFLFQKMYLIVP